MQASKIVAAVASNTLSPDHDNDDILDIINRGLIEIAGGGDRQHGNAELAPLPDLFTSDTVTLTAGDTVVDLPDDFQRNVTRVVYAGETLSMYANMNKFLDAMESSSGDLCGCCVKGKRLWVGPAQSSDVILTVYYHSLPDELQIVDYDAGPPEVEAVDSIPSCLPDHLQFPLLYHYASKEIFSEIEQGLDGAMPDTLKHDALYQKALTDLERFIGPADGEAINISDEYYTDDMSAL